MTTGTWDTLSWTKDGKTIVGDAHMVIASNELTIQGVVRGDAGTYSCSVKNPFSDGTSQNQLTVYYGPDMPTISIMSPTDPQPARFVLVNSTVTLTCSTSSEPPAQYLWSVGESSDTNVPSNPVLIFDRIQLDQAGIYSCIVTNARLSRTVRKTQMITVYELPQGEPSCSMVSIQDHRVLQLTCSWTGGIPKAEVRWVGLSRKVSAFSQLVYNESSPASLSGSNVTCVANHSAAVKYCIVQPVAPLVILTRRVVRETQGDATVTLTCEVRSNPASIIHWFKGEKVLRSNGKLIISPNSSELHIRNFSLENDTGNYSCSCRNPLGENRPSLILTAPLIMDVTVQRLNRTAASIVWEVRGSDVVTSFLVQSQVLVLRARSSSWVTLQEAGMAERAVTINQLREDQGYSFRVLPLTGTQQGAPSPTQSVAPAIDNRLSAGAIAGIVVGCVVGALLILLLIILLIRYKRRKAGTEKQTANKKEQRSDWDRKPQKAPERSAPAGVTTTRTTQAKPQRSISNRTQLTIDEWDRASSVDQKSLYLNGPYTVSNWRSLERMSPGNTAGKMASIGRMPEHSSSQSHLKSPTLTPQNRSATMV
ncbi:V-set and immunoglobulin domain-containing protein 10-like isoform X2 [Scyliorhinus canicula]|uniref:V-set and immunoglobulin domain-containing protein 10-like isoform X2 n=1 Tax=Scyliorhinus canicula TaxID=7830 RepID=UPI0018F701F2|nr:V-set and immunoglobulin domain-containing protein 10-like isoform X2 [Scyliorhinus canicula]